MSLSAKRPTKNIKEQLLEEVQNSNAPKKRLNAEIEAELYLHIRSRALMEDRSVSEITRQLWIKYLNQHKT